ncbi:hypothetical protein, partial [Enterococcus faecium]|uniref:hypothetical protein n=1 Tax=Enterococcus faecium TaxID=1352 RepID=UPI001C9DC182
CNTILFVHFFQSFSVFRKTLPASGFQQKETFGNTFHAETISKCLQPQNKLPPRCFVLKIRHPGLYFILGALCFAAGIRFCL